MPTSGGGSSPTARLPVVALVGRPNVGKSSLFNRLLGRREAIVLDRPGVTRDRIERQAVLRRHLVTLLDTGGIVPDTEEELVAQVSAQALSALRQADLVLMVVDARAGVVPLDEQIVSRLRCGAAHSLLVMNKCDTTAAADLASDGWRLGLGEPCPVSAEHGHGIETLIERIERHLDQRFAPSFAADDDQDPHRLPPPEQELHVAIVGRPNVGKSSLVNRLAGAERVTVSSIPGTTRDAIDVRLTRDGRHFRLIDTAGMRRRAKTTSQDESIGILLTRRRLARAHVAIQVVDAAAGLTSGDVAIAGEIEAAGRPLLLAINKWDLVESPESAVKDWEQAIAGRLAFLPPGLPRLTVSAHSGQRVFKLLDQAADLAQSAVRRVSTSELNRFLESTTARLIVDGGAISKLLYITQTGVLPPRFVIFCRDTEQVTPAQRRFLEHRIREAFELGPVPISIELRASPRR